MYSDILTKDCVDSRAVATFGPTFASNGSSILSTRLGSCQYISVRSPGLAIAVVPAKTPLSYPLMVKSPNGVDGSDGSIFLPPTLAGDGPIQGSLQGLTAIQGSPAARGNR